MKMKQAVIKMYPDPGLGYLPEQYGRMRYCDWIKKQGLYRWTHEDGTPRTIYPVAEYATIYNYVCKTADIAFMYRDIPEDVDGFTCEFLATVPLAWMKYKTQLELLSGTLNGTNIDPDIFEAGYDRTHRVTTNTDTHTDAESNSSGQANQEYGQITGTSNSDATITNYEQGIQPYEPNEQLGRDYASAAARNKQDTTSTQETHTDSSNTTGRDTTTASGTIQEIMNEVDHMTRINYYDNLAFLRDRFDRLKQLRNFNDYFDPLFSIAYSFTPWYS